jgi:o-succinylbenzoate synthase
VNITSVELVQVRMPLVAPFRTSHGAQTERDALLVHVVSPEHEGWGECVAPADPSYSSEYLGSAREVLRTWLVPAVLQASDVTAVELADRLRFVKGHRMAKAALEMAVLDAELRAAGLSLAAYLGATAREVPAGVSVGIQDSVDALLTVVGRFIDEGYRRVKLKIEPGWDLEPVAAVRRRWPDLPLQADANGAYTLDDANHLAGLDAFGLLLVEQPFDDDDLAGHAALARRLATPVCLDESITSLATAELALSLGACSVVNIKAGRVGGHLEARRIHDCCLERGVPVWCGGMLETGLGRAANLALAALPGFTLPGDLSASDRFYADDLTEPFVLRDGHLAVPTGPGTGIELRMDVVARATVWRERLTR